ncbi:MAG: arginase [bacterium]|nr:arginase [bacterium]
MTTIAGSTLYRTTPGSSIHIYGAPMDLGQSRRGVDMGPSALRYAELQRRLQMLGCTVEDRGNINVPVMESVRDDDPSDGIAHNLATVGQVCQAIYQQGLEANAARAIPIFLGGDHSIAIGSISAMLEKPGKLGVIWVDAHGDFNTPVTSPSGNVHGMVVAALMGRCPPEITIGSARLQPDQIVMIGTRDLDEEERVSLAASGIQVYTMRAVDELGVSAAARAALKQLEGVDSIHVSLDLDSLDPQFAPGVGTPVPGGLTYREAHLLMEILADDGRVGSLDIVEVNPILDRTNQTADLAVELTASLFGKRIL